MKVKGWKSDTAPCLTRIEHAHVEWGEYDWRDVAAAHAAITERGERPARRVPVFRPLTPPEPAVTEFGRSERETGFDPALADLAATATIVALACLVIYVLSRVLP